MSVTAWEYRKALSDRLRAVRDTQRDGVLTWQQAFVRAQADVVARLHRDADTITAMTWADFRRLQGWHDEPEMPSVGVSKKVDAVEPTSRSQALADAGFTRRPIQRTLELRSALQLIAVPQCPDGTWNLDREACRDLAAEALGRYDDSKTPNAKLTGAPRNDNEHE